MHLVENTNVDFTQEAVHTKKTIYKFKSQIHT